MESPRPLETMDKTPRMTTRGAVANAFRSTADFLMKPVRTAAAMLRKPGAVALEYIEGIRDSVMSPGMFAFGCATAYMAAHLFFNTDMASFFDPLASYRNFWPYFGVAMLAPAAALQRFLFRRQRFNFAETMSFALYVFGELALLNIVLEALQRVSHHEFPMLAFLLPQGLYATWAATGFYRDKRWSVWFRSALAYAFYIGITWGLVALYQWYRLRHMFG